MAFDRYYFSYLRAIIANEWATALGCSASYFTFYIQITLFLNTFTLIFISTCYEDEGGHES